MSTSNLAQCISQARVLVLEASQHEHLSETMIECGERLRQALTSAEEGLCNSSRSHVRAALLRSEISDLRQSLDAVFERRCSR